jgi:spermidine synthase
MVRGAAWLCGGLGYDAPMSSQRALRLFVAAAAGAATMAGELAAVRLLAPWFGASTVVWTNVIGIELLALSIGYLWGARLARGEHPRRVLARLLLFGGVWYAAAPHLARACAALFLPEGLALDAAAGVVHWGSLASACVLFLAPLVALGAVAPLVVEWWTREESAHAGTAGGIVLCASTIGSLLGTFGATHWLVPSFGVVATFAGAGLALVACGVVSAWSGRRAPALALVLVPVLALATPARTGPGPRDGERVLAEVDSPLQRVRVVERAADGWRFLQVNEAFDSFQSAWKPEPGLLGGGYYYDFFALPLMLAPRGSTFRAGFIGLGAGTAWRVMQGVRPPDVDLRGEGAEIDVAVVELARRHLDLPSEDGSLRVHAGVDGRVFLRHVEGTFDLLVVDAYQNQVEIPPHLATREFWSLCRAKLADGGWLMANVGSFGLGDPLLEAIARAMAAGLREEVRIWRVPFSRNAILCARRAAPVPDPALVASGSLELDARLAAIALPGMQRRISPGAADADALVDDRAPLEYLGQESLRRASLVLRGEVAP